MTLPDRARLEAAARRVLAQFDPDDLDRLLASVHGLDELIDKMVARAEDVCRALGAPVPLEHDDLLLLATLTRQGGSAGVHVKNVHAVESFKRLRSMHGIAIPVALRIRQTDSSQLVAALDTAYRLSVDLASVRDEPPVFQVMIAAAAAALRPADPVAAAAAILDRGAELAGSYCASSRPLPGPALPVLGDPHFLVQLAGYARAVRERAGVAQIPDPLDHVEKLASELERWARRAMTRAPRYPVGHTDGPDVVGFFSEAASLVGAESTAATGGVMTREIFQRLTHGLQASRVGHDKRLVSTDPGDLAAGSPVVDPIEPVLETLGYATELAAQIVAVLSAGTTYDERLAIAWWVCGRRAVDQTDDLRLLLSHLRGLMAALDGPGPSMRLPADSADSADSVDSVDPADPVDPGAPEIRLMTLILRKKIEAQLALEPGRLGSRDLATGALPPLWTARGPIIRALAQRIKQDEGMDGPGKQRRHLPRILAARAARGPGQFVLATNGAQHDPGKGCVTVHTANFDAPPRCDERVGRWEPDVSLICPARPWGEAGCVDSDATIGDLLDLTVGAVRAQLTHYTNDGGGPWLKLAQPSRP